ncbi:iron ABC transporter substrate-binding protein [Agaricicola taiwanensis]|uniref:Iron ABC transporter substrate-binding protein n=1 Tax=Agaricicola taiwanensis TaxID=591372 RepID=A0A8J2VMI9_9RHOB|nr:extracellular solute-binding protein [Agaricicola taiwanensis]GGE32818.1 iron ABC transporter substrate-binding protein [Agaricicola taiwanensis]
MTWHGDNNAGTLAGAWVRKITSCAVAIAAALSLSTVTAGAQENWDEVLAGAKKEGKVVLYSNLQPNGVEALLQKFREDHPDIATEQIRLGAPPMLERFVAEYNSGRHIVDVMITYPDERLLKGIDEEDWAMTWTPPELKNFAPEHSRKNQLFTLQQAREAIIWNKNLVTDDEAPKEWTDLFDPKWKGKIGFNPPWRALAIQQIIAYWEDELKLGDTAAKLKAQDVRFFEGSGGIIQAVVRGDVAVAELTDIPLHPLLEDGAPVGFIYPKSGTTVTNGVGFVAAKAPHPNAAKVFLNWLMTEKGQEQLLTFGGLSVTRTGAKSLEHLPATTELPKVVDGLSLIDSERQAKIVNHYRTTFGVR